MKITCRGLVVNASATVTVDPDETVADLKRKLDVDRPGWGKCSLYHEGRKLESSMRLGSLRLSVGSFLTVIERKSKTSGKKQQLVSERRRQAQEASQSLAGSCLSNAPAEHTPAPAAGGSDTDACKAGAAVGAGFFVAPDIQKQQSAKDLETLLPGYASRPNPSPVKKQRTAISHPVPTSPQLPSAPLPPRPLAEAAGIAHRLRSNRHKAAIQDNAGPHPVVQEDGENPRHAGSGDARAASSSLCRASRRTSNAPGSSSSGGPAPGRIGADGRGKGGEAGSTEALTRRDVALLVGLPLPPVLERLHRIFQRLNLLYSFLLRHHIPMTWRNVQEALRRHLSCDCPEPQDLQDMCKLCPTVVFFRDRQWSQRRAAYGVHNEPEPQQHTTDAGQSREARQKLGQARAETLSQLMKDAKPEEVEDLVFEVADPGRSWLHPCKGTKSSQSVPTVQDVPAPGPGETMEQEQADNMAARSGAEVRREQAFRLGLALAVQHLQDMVLERAAGCAAAERMGVATSEAEFGTAGDVLAPLVQELVHRNQLQQPGSMAASGSSDGGKPTQTQPAAAAGCSWDWDILDRQRWHPLLDISKIGLAQLKAAQQVAADSSIQDKDDVGGGIRNAFEWEDLESNGTGSSHPRRRHAHERAPRPPGLMKRHPTCTSTDALDPDGILDHLKSLPWYENQAVHEHSIPARPARYAEPQVPLPEGLKQALAAKNVKRLFLHQAMALDALARGQHIVVSTSTASGKSLCYNIPILQALVERSDASALYMFPTKALAQDQLRALQDLCHSLFPHQQGPCIDVYDGDTPQAERPAIRQRVQLLITNPDMLHRSILPVHQQFQRFLSCLRYVVVDELHSYTGVFGCHTALVLRRLRRLCHHRYPTPDSAQDRPQFIATSATTANPETHALQLLGVTNVQVISEDGSPHGAKRIVLWNPPLTLKAKGLAAARAAKKAEQESGTDAQVAFEAEQPAPGSMSEATKGVGTADNQEMDDASLLSKTPGPSRKRYRGRAGLKSKGQVQSHGALPSELAELAAQAVLKRHRSAAASLKTGAAGNEAGEQPSIATLRSSADAGDSGSSAGEGQRREGPGHVPCSDSKHDTAAASSKDAAEAAVAAEAVCSAAGEERSGPEAAARPAAMALSKRHKSLARRLASSQASHREAERPLIRLKGGSYSATSSRIVRVQPGMEPGVANRQLDEAAKTAQRRMPGPEWKDRSGTAGTPRALRRVSPMVQISMLLAECIQHGLRTIAFCHTRKLAELVTALTRESLNASAPHLAERLCVYRAGYQPEQRRAIEKALFQGRLRAVAATNALELGLDVGFLDCTLHLGFPPSIASLWQQAGRAGRREQTSLAIVVGFDSPMDQFYFKNPDYLFGRPLERAQVDTQNPGLLEQHVGCAAFEHPLVLDKDEAFLGPGLRAAALNLVRDGQLAATPGMSSAAAGLHYTGPQSMPSASITLRAIDPERYSIVNEATGEVIEEIEECMAFYSIYDGAVYMYQGRPHLCKKMDLSSKVAVVRPADVKYYTTTRDFTDIHVIGSHGAYPVLGPPGAQPSADSATRASFPPTSARWGEALVTTRFLGFHRIWQGSGKLFDTVDLFLPDVQYHTEAAYIRVPARARTACQDAGLLFREGVHAAAHSIMNILHLYIMCNPGDMGSECDSPYEERYRPERLLIYDKRPGGIGLAAQARPLFTQLLRQALLLVESCDCELSTGCPQCVHRTDCPEYNSIVDKEAAKVVLRHTLQVELERWGAAGSVEGDDNSQPAVGP